MCGNKKRTKGNKRLVSGVSKLHCLPLTIFQALKIYIFFVTAVVVISLYEVW